MTHGSCGHGRRAPSRGGAGSKSCGHRCADRPGELSASSSTCSTRKSGVIGRTGRSFAVLLMDLDGLKIINDRHGHLTGSRALCRLADILRVHCRDIDTAARYGGDEFALVIPEAGPNEAQQVAPRIRERVAQDARGAADFSERRRGGLSPRGKRGTRCSARRIASLIRDEAAIAGETDGLARSDVPVELRSQFELRDSALFSGGEFGGIFAVRHARTPRGAPGRRRVSMPRRLIF